MSKFIETENEFLGAKIESFKIAVISFVIKIVFVFQYFLSFMANVLLNYI